ncbi:MAG: response regulator transcription factor [Candidatus Omnitrophica bacterium]|nr:response regulator transcription factor [Candidatus Omnitrophota bacterium]MBU1808587.1 response regulator transcription factor [Candidatus Omnitrophota bacterium]
MKVPDILLVDDESGQRENLRNYLEPRIKCNIAEVSNAQEAIDFIRKNPCDIMVLDIKMPGPGGSGVEVLGVSKDLPIVVLVYTNWDSDQVYKQCMERNIKGYIAKSDSLTIIGEKIVKELKEKKIYFPI